jgi:hypothetical protein
MMRQLSRLLIFISVLMVVGGGIFLAVWDFPAPTQSVEETLPDARFPK